MSSHEKIEIGGTLALEIYKWGHGDPTVEFTYTEHSSDHWHSDRETEVSIDKATAERIVAALRKHFEF